MHHIFSDLDTLIALPFQAFEKKLTKFEEEFKNISVTDIDEEELEAYFIRLREEYTKSTHDAAKVRLAVIGYLSHFDTLIEKYFPEYVTLFQTSFEREDGKDIAPVLYGFLEHMDEILREYTHRLSEPDQYPSYTSYVQEFIRNSMIDLFFWLQDREKTQEATAKEEDKNTDIHIVASADTKNPDLQFTRKCLELLGDGVLEKIFFDLGYLMRTSTSDPELHLIGRYERKTKE